MFTRTRYCKVGLSRANYVNTVTHHFPKIYYNIIIQSKPRYFCWSLPLRFSDNSWSESLILPGYVTWCSHIVIFSIKTP
jgi:hypothetical protein